MTLLSADNCHILAFLNFHHRFGLFLLPLNHRIHVAVLKVTALLPLQNGRINCNLFQFDQCTLLLFELAGRIVPYGHLFL